ncbi:MAG TPA: NAD(P)/FAD-dependent oxidoreductase [Chthonomonadaceae bacterium]|nr:NAD(P)/FAD-dependent oxidoreductase [Chthonomonadaceae bacterium]
MTHYDALVIGAGHNGLIAACYLARAGRRVLVLERREIVGGACVTEDVWPGYRVSTAAYLCSLLHPQIVRDLELERYGFEVYRRETAGFAPFPDGRSLLLHADADRTRSALAEFCRDTPADVEAFFAFERDVERAAAIVEQFLLREPPTEAEVAAAFEREGAAELYPQFVTGSVRALLDARFQSDALKTVLATDGLIGTYGGPSTPGTAYVLLHHYLGRILGARGAWGYVRGGMGRITQALAESLRAAGGEIRTSAPVLRILREGGRAVGVALETGEEILAPAVLSNADPYHTFAELLPAEVLGYSGVQVFGPSGDQAFGQAGVTAEALPANVHSLPPTRITEHLTPYTLKSHGGASAKINLAVTELPRFTCLPARPGGEPGPEHLGTVHLCPSLEHLERAWNEASGGLPSTEPMIEMYVQTATDRSLAPPGRHILSLFVQYFPYNLRPGLDLDVERDRFADRVIAIIGRYAPNVPASIEHRQVLTPCDLERRFGLTGGHIFHGDLLPPALWSERPARGFFGARTPLPGLFLCGSGAHPGGCVFGAPGFNAARAVAGSWQMLPDAASNQRPGTINQDPLARS